MHASRVAGTPSPAFPGAGPLSPLRNSIHLCVMAPAVCVGTVTSQPPPPTAGAGTRPGKREHLTHSECVWDGQRDRSQGKRTEQGTKKKKRKRNHCLLLRSHVVFKTTYPVGCRSPPGLPGESPSTMMSRRGEPSQEAEKNRDRTTSFEKLESAKCSQTSK